MRLFKHSPCLTINLLLLLLLLLLQDSSIVRSASVGSFAGLHIERIFHDDTIKRKTVILDEGDSITLECGFPANQPSDIRWSKVYFSNGSKHDTLNARKTYIHWAYSFSPLNLNNVTENDEGNYSCISTTEDEAQAFEFNVLVNDRTYCNAGTCGDNGTCKLQSNGFLCMCNPGYKGNNCEFAEPCFENPCHNNGSCTAIGQNFNCTCETGYRGKLCEKKVCLPSTCGYSAGTCSETDDGDTSCSCKYNFAGKSCEAICRFSNFFSCIPGIGLTCVVREGGYERCYCNEFHSNENYCIHHSDLMDECTDPGICNGGICTDYRRGYKCDCNIHRSGRHCETIHECQPEKRACWEYRGTCIDHADGFRCKCPTRNVHCQQTTKPCTLTCKDDHMMVTCNMQFLNTKLQTILIKTNPGRDRCVYENGSVIIGDKYLPAHGHGADLGIFHTRIKYTECETKAEFKDDYVIYTNSLRGGLHDESEKGDDIITRLPGTFQFNMMCKQPLKTKQSSVGIQSISLRSDESLQGTGEESIEVQTKIAYFDKDWKTISNYKVGQRLYVMVSLVEPTKSRILSNMVLRPATCYATPGKDLQEPRHILLDNRCIKDETFRFEEDADGPDSLDDDNILRIYFSFDSFSFIGIHDAKLYIHCISVFVNQTESEYDAAECKTSVNEDATDAKQSDFNMSSSTSSRFKRDSSFLEAEQSQFTGNVITSSDVIDRRPSGTVDLI